MTIIAKSGHTTSNYGGNGSSSTLLLIRILCVVLSLFTIWYNTRTSITTTLSFIAFDYHNGIVIKPGCSNNGNDNNQTRTNNRTRTRTRTRTRQQHLPLLTSQTYVISFHQKKVTELFHQRNMHTGFYSNTKKITTKSSNENNNDDDEKEGEVRWFPAVNGRDPLVLDEWAHTAHPDFPKITPDMGREGYPMPPYQDSGSTESNSTTTNNWEKNEYLSPHVIGCYESHRRLLTLASQSWKMQKHAYPTTKTKDKDDDASNKDKNHDEDGDDADTTTTTTTKTVVPDALFIFEDDALCVDDTKQQIMELLPLLPESWDIVMMGGKPFSYLTNPDENEHDYYDEERDSVFASTTEKEHFLQEIENCNDEIPCPLFRHYACVGKFGTSATGPFGKDGGGTVGQRVVGNTTSNGTRGVQYDLALARRSLQPYHPITQPYWKMNYVIDSHAYVINPQHIQKVLNVLHEHRQLDNPLENFRPIDIVLADGMNAHLNHNHKQGLDSLQAYVPAKGEYCQQVPNSYEEDLQAKKEEQDYQEQKKLSLQLRKSTTASSSSNQTNITNKTPPQGQQQQQQQRVKTQPPPWQGYYHHNSFPAVIWEELYFHDCPESYLNGLL